MTTETEKEFGKVFGLYVLKGKEPVRVKTIEEWARSFERMPDRRVALTVRGRSHVSTVFLGIDHAFTGGPPQLFETMAFKNGKSGELMRCATWEEAERQHERMCKKLWPTG